MIAIVSGLPRRPRASASLRTCPSGMAALSDGERQADVDNPRGYLEWEKIKQLPNDPGCIAEGEGKVVKVFRGCCCRFRPATSIAWFLCSVLCRRCSHRRTRCCAIGERTKKERTRPSFPPLSRSICAK